MHHFTVICPVCNGEVMKVESDGKINITFVDNGRFYCFRCKIPVSAECTEGEVGRVVVQGGEVEDMPMPPPIHRADEGEEWKAGS